MRRLSAALPFTNQDHSGVHTKTLGHRTISCKIYTGIILCFVMNCIVLLVNFKHIDPSDHHHWSDIHTLSFSLRNKNATDTAPAVQSTETLYETIASMTESDQRALLQHFIHVLEPSLHQQPQQDTPEESSSNPFEFNHRIGGKAPLDNATLEMMMNQAIDTIVTNTFPISESPHISQMQTIIDNLNQLSFQEQSHVFNTLNGREFPYPLSCPNSALLHSTTTSPPNYSVVISYHVGLLANWRDIVRDQMTTLQVCGLGNIMTLMFVTYTQDNADNSLEELIRIMNRYSFASKITYHKGPDDIVPFEASALNVLHEYCRKQQQQQQPLEEETKKIVVFYFHNKGCSHYEDIWRQREVILETWTYAFALFWRKYLEYFLLERPGLCIDQIVNQGADACGVHLIDDEYYDDLYFSGNFWAASCNHIQSLQAVQTEPIKAFEDPKYSLIYIAGERWIGANTRPRNPKFVSLHNNTNGLYKHLINPDEYSDYSHRWL